MAAPFTSEILVVPSVVSVTGAVPVAVPVATINVKRPNPRVVLPAIVVPFPVSAHV